MGPFTFLSITVHAYNIRTFIQRMYGNYFNVNNNFRMNKGSCCWFEEGERVRVNITLHYTHRVPMCLSYIRI
jgi:hypothetical protein